MRTLKMSAVLATILFASATTAHAQTSYPTWVQSAGGTNFTFNTAQEQYGGAFSAVPYFNYNGVNTQLPAVGPAPTGINLLYAYNLPLTTVQAVGPYCNLIFYKAATVTFYDYTTNETLGVLDYNAGDTVQVNWGITDVLFMFIETSDGLAVASLQSL